MNFIDATETCLKKWVTFSGRASRSEFWWFTLFNVLFSLFQQASNEYLNAVTDREPANLTLLILSLIASLILLVCSVWIGIGGIFAIVRRLHDVNRSGWWYWIALTLIGIFFPLLYWECKKGTPGDNRFGPDPLAAQG